MKNLIFINGTLGIGKTTTSKQLQKLLPKCVCLDGDWCFDMLPFIVPAYVNTTVNNKFMSAEQSYKYYNDYIWNGRYAECISLDETIEGMK